MYAFSTKLSRKLKPLTVRCMCCPRFAPFLAGLALARGAVPHGGTSLNGRAGERGARPGAAGLPRVSHIEAQIVTRGSVR